MNARPATTRTVGAPRPALRRPLATARPGLDYLRAAFVAEWDAAGIAGVGDLAPAFLQAAGDTPEAVSDIAAIARWAMRLQQGSSVTATAN